MGWKASGTALLALLVLAPSAQAAFPGANGRILVQAPDPGNPFASSIQSLAPDGSGRVQVVSSWTGGAASSPDGSRIAYARHTDQGYRIAVTTADGRGETLLTTTTGQPSSPAWSPDSRRIAFTILDAGRFSVWVMAADGSNRQMVAPDGYSPQWAPDGSRIAYIGNDAPDSRGPAIWMTNPDGTDRRLVLPGAIGPEWDPTGERIAYARMSSTRGADVYTARPDGTDERNLTAALAPAPATGFPPISRGTPAWSPDGRRIAFTNTPPDGTPELWIMKRDGAQPGPIPGSDGLVVNDWAVDTPIAPGRSRVYRVKSRQRLRSVLAHGLRITFSCTAACSAAGELRTGSRALEASRSVRIAKGIRRRARMGTGTLVVRVARALRDRLARSRTLRTTLTVRISGEAKARRRQGVTLTR